MDGLSSTTALLVVVFIAVLIIAFKGVVKVNQSKVRLVERLGKYHRTLGSGINFIVPFLDEVKYEHDISEQQIAITGENVTSADNVQIIIGIQAFYRITDAAHYQYRIEDGKRAIKTTIDATVRALVGRRTLDQLNADRLHLAVEIAEEVRNTATEWGVSMNRVEITDVRVRDEALVNSLKLQAQAERERRQSVIEAEGKAQTIKLEAEAAALEIRLMADAQLYKAQKEAEATRITAEAQAWALSTKGAALESSGAQFAQHSEILRAQVDAFQSLGTAENSKIYVVPSDLVQTAASLTSLLRK